MILDAQLILSSAQAITVTAPSTGTYDAAGVGVGVAPPNWFGVSNAVFGQDSGIGHGSGRPTIVCQVTTAFTAGGAGTLQVQLQASVDSGAPGYTPSSWVTLVESDTLSLAQLAGTLTGNLQTYKIAEFDIPPRAPNQNLPRFYRLNYVVGTGPMTAGAVSAYINTGRDDGPIYPASY
jgi:hypothetical protein